MLQVVLTNAPELREKMSRLQREIVKNMRDLIYVAAERALKRTKELTPEDTGRTREQWNLWSLNRKQPEGRFGGAFFVAVRHPYNRVGKTRMSVDDFGKRKKQVVNDGKFNLLEALEYGTRAHTIRAKPGKFLRFKIGAKEIYTKSVSHPGTRAYNMTTIAAAEATQFINGRIADVLARATRGF